MSITDTSFEDFKNNNENDYKHIYVNIEHTPITNCCIRPEIRYNGIDTDDASTTVTFQWYKTDPIICSYTDCGLPAKIQCMTCDESELTISDQQLKDSFFCSTNHYKLLSKSHQDAYHPNNTTDNYFSDILSQFDHKLCINKKTKTPKSNLIALNDFWPKQRLNVWKELSKEQNYTPTKNDLACMLKLIVTVTTTTTENKENKKENNQEIIKGEYSTRPTLLKPALHRQRQTIVLKQDTNDYIKVMTYNILSQRLALSKNYPYCPSWALQWGYRKELIIYEMLVNKPDVICVQEISQKQFLEFFLPILSAKGDYDGIFQPKAKRSEGVAIFYKKEKYILLQRNVVDLSESAKTWVGTIHTELNRKKLKRLIHGNICLVVVLEEIPVLNNASKRRFVVASPHIFWDPKFPDVKLWQSISIVKYLEKYYYEEGLPLIIAGDFNSGIYSSAYEYLTSGKVLPGHRELDHDKIGILPRIDEIRHGLPLASGYAILGEPSFSNYTANFVDLIDYIFFTQTNFHVLEALDIYKKKEMKEYVALPSPKHPSDHIPLMITLGWNR